MLQLLAQYQHYIYTVFITVEVLRYLYGAYNSWRSNQTRIRRVNAAVELFAEAYSTMVQVIIFKKFRSLGNNARIAFNTLVEPERDITEGMWTVMNVVMENFVKQYGLLSDGNDLHKMYPEFCCRNGFTIVRKYPVIDSINYQKQDDNPEKEKVRGNFGTPHRFNMNPADNMADPNPEQPAQPSGSLATMPVTEHPLQTNSVEKSIYEGMELASSQDDDSATETVKRPRFGIASTSGLNTSK